MEGFVVRMFFWMVVRPMVGSPGLREGGFFQKGSSGVGGAG